MKQATLLGPPPATAAWLPALVAAVAVAGCSGGAGNGSSAAAPLQPIALSVTPTSIALGQTATLSWSAAAGSTCTGTGSWSGAQPTSGTLVVQPGALGQATYTLSCAVASDGGGYGGGGGTTERTATLTVSPATVSAFTNTTLVGDAATGARTADPNLVNPWGVAVGPTTATWIVNNGTGTATVYDGNGVAQPHAAPLVVSFPTDVSGAPFSPTAIVANPSGTAFVVTSATQSAAATFLFAGESGRIGAWTGSVDPIHVVTTYTDPGNAVYKGLAIASRASASFLYATDFRNAKIDVFDTNFAKQPRSATSFSFADPTLPAGYAPFGIQAVDDGPGGSARLYVSYAQQAPPANREPATGAGTGLVDVFDSNGTLITRLVAVGGPLNAPWGIARAPADFGSLGGKLLVGNFGDGQINAFDPVSGQFLGAVADPSGIAFVAPGLWGISFGNDARNQPHNTLFYAAAGGNGGSGIVGRIDAGAAAPALGTPPSVTVTAPSGTVNGVVAVTATATDPLGITSVQFFVNNVTLGVLTAPPYVIPWDSTTSPDGPVLLNAKATDADGNVAVSPAVTVTVANAAAAATLAQLQADVFTPVCAGCHNGSVAASGPLPASQNLTAGNSFANLVGVASHEQAATLRVAPGDPTNSYLIQKLEGAAGIGGERMPLGGPYLDQATIDRIRSWIAAGAANN